MAATEIQDETGRPARRSPGNTAEARGRAFQQIAASPGRITRRGFSAAVPSPHAPPLPGSWRQWPSLMAVGRLLSACPRASGRG